MSSGSKLVAPDPSTALAPSPMHIKKLEITGFKSFVDRTLIHFDRDVVGIVGPNGSGKSNIVDALRWCMGEQSPRQLRGKSMDEVIFTGSENRKPHGFAEVTLTFGNTDPAYAQTLPIEYRDFAEIAVTRRLFRDGTSAYLINNSPVRLKDITDLLLGTGLGSKAYSIVEQGKIGIIVSSKPEDRRLLIEEAAGITKYKHRKKQAEKKMEMTRQNLLRVSDIISEIERSLAGLKRQAAKVQRYLGYRHELEDLVLYQASHRLLELMVVGRQVDAADVMAREALQRVNMALAAKDALLEATRQEAVRLEQELEQEQRHAALADGEARDQQVTTQRTLDQYRNLQRREREAVQELSGMGEQLQRLGSELAEVERQMGGLEQLAREQERTLQRDQREMNALESQRGELSKRSNWLRTELSTSEKQLATTSERIAAIDRREEELRLRGERIAIDTERLQEDLLAADDRRVSAAEQLKELLSEQTQTKHRVTDLQQRLQDADTHRQQCAQRTSSLHEQRQRQSANLEAVERLHRRLEGIADGPRTLVQQHNEKIIGLVAELIQPPENMLTPLAALLGERLQWLVVSDMDWATSRLNWLASEDKGRATVMPVRPLRMAPSCSPPQEPGILGRLVDHISVPEQHADWVSSLVGDAVLIDDMQPATALRKRCPQSPLVTTSGTVYWPDGSISGGSTRSVSASLLEQQLQIRTLTSTVNRLSDDWKVAKAEQDAAEQRTTEFQQQLEETRQFDNELALEIVGARSELQRADDVLMNARMRLQELGRQREELERIIDDSSVERADRERDEREARKRIDEIRQKLQDALRDTQMWEEKVQQRRSELTNRKVEFTRVHEQALSSRATRKRIEMSKNELSTRTKTLQRQIVEAAISQGRLAAQLFSHGERGLQLEHVARRAHETLAQRRQALDEARSSLGTLDVQVRDLRTASQRAAEQHNSLQQQKQRLDLEREHLLRSVADRFRGLQLQRVVGDYHLKPAPTDQTQHRIDELTRLLDRMGPVNLDATSEYEQTKERYEFYATQRDDLNKALGDLDSAISQMNRQSRHLFHETFNSVSQRFQTIFPKLFDGGRAELVLTDPSDLLTTGVEIRAQPPGKRVSSIDLLSGGEKALTAVSLIFAIFQHRPSPFCVLDEVDAPLDEANVTRFADLVRSMTSRSQFILITHIKRTMQSVDVLYGVTMQEPGVSKIVGVTVNEGGGGSDGAVRREREKPSSA